MLDNSDVEEDQVDDPSAFVIEKSVSIRCKELKLNVKLSPKFVKELDAHTFFLCDFYQSRGVYSILTCRLDEAPSKGPRCYTDLQSVAKDIRQLRDSAHQLKVKSSQLTTNARFDGDRVVPRQPELRSQWLAQDEIIEVLMPAIGDQPGYNLKCIARSASRN